MSTKNTTISTAVATVSTNVHSETAQTHLQGLRQMRATIPNFVIPASGKDTAKLSAAASVPAEFVELTAVAVTNEEVLVRGGARTPAEVRDLMAYADAFGPLADELEAHAQFVRHSVTLARNIAGYEALTTYSLAQRLAKRPEHAGLATYVADMRRALNRGRKLTAEQKAAKKAAKAKAEQVPPVTEPKPSKS